LGHFLMTLNDRETHTITSRDIEHEGNNLAQLGATSAGTPGNNNDGDGADDDERRIRNVDARIMAVVIW
jgi:hypothetical protein